MNSVLSLWSDEGNTFYIQVHEGVGWLDDAWLLGQILTVLLHNERVFPRDMEAVCGGGGRWLSNPVKTFFSCSQFLV